VKLILRQDKKLTANQEMRVLKMRKHIIVSGYATIDYVLNLKAPFDGSNIAHVHPVSANTWERPGGATLYTSVQLAKFDVDAYPLVWLGKDAKGQAYLNTCEKHGLLTGAIDIQDSRATPSCFLLYHEDGSQGCLIDNGENGHETKLVQTQIDLTRKADMVCITAGPPTQTDTLLEYIPEDAVVAWIAKQDDACFPKKLREKIARRANYIFCNSSERNYVDDSLHNDRRSDLVIVETRGPDGVLIETPNDAKVIEVTRVDSDDTTGAGDTFAGATLGALITGESNIEDAVTNGVVAAQLLLESRL